VVDALEVIAREYAQLRKKSVNLHLDAKFLLSGPQSDISDVLNHVYESILRIIDDAIASKNERVAQHCIDSMGRMAVHAMSIVASRAHDQQIAPLAFGAVYYFSRAARAVLTANMLDAILHTITALQNVLLKRTDGIDLTGVAETVNDTLFEIAASSYATKNRLAIFRSVEAMLHSAQFEIAREDFDADSLKSTLRRILPLVPIEVIADSAGLRHLQVFPPYDPGFEASIPMLLQNIAHKVRIDTDRPWFDPFADLSDATEAVRDHYRDLTKIDFGHVLLHKYAIGSLGLVLRVLFNQVSHPPEGTDEFVQTVVSDLTAQISWMSGFFPDEAKAYSHVSDATASLTILGIDALDHDEPGIATACANTLSRIAVKVGIKLKSWDLADVHRDMEILARAADATQNKKFAILVRSMITLPAVLTPEMTNMYSDAQQTRLRQLDESLADAGRRPYRMRDDPVERLYQLVSEPKDADGSEEQH
jgi:hypothetical protein